MVESVAGSKKHVALDTDWMSATVAVCGFFVFGLLGTGMTWRMLHGKIGVETVNWWTLLFAAGFIYAAIETRGLFRVAILIYAIGPVSRAILWLGRASAQTVLTNEIFVQCIDITLFFSVSIYLTYWFKTKLRHV